MFLALALRQLGYTIYAAHCNFRLRGDEAARDEQFCVSFCQANDIPLHLAHFDTRSYATLHHVSIEMAARELRYAYFEQLCRHIADTSGKSCAICVAHHRDDSVETVLMNLIRGTGIQGLCGIQPRRNNIIRPLLCLSRQEIEQALNDCHQPLMTDSTNLEDDEVRNKIRLTLMPLLRQINPSVSDSIARTAERLTPIAKSLETLVDDHELQQQGISNIEQQSISNIAQQSIDNVTRQNINNVTQQDTDTLAEERLFRRLRPYGFSSLQIEQAYALLSANELVSGRVFESSTHRLLIDRNQTIIEEKAPNNPTTHRPMLLPEEGLYVYNKQLRFRVEYVAGQAISRSGDILCADRANIALPLTIRPTTDGDRFVPFGMSGSKLVSDFLTDRKVNLFDKQRQLVVADATGKILWIVGHRTSNLCRITPTTQQTLRITLIKD